MNAASLLRTLVARLHDAGIPFMLTGSLAAAVHGAGRATLGIDLVIEPDGDQLMALVRSLSDAGLYVSDTAALDALQRRTMFNAVDVSTGWKADLIIRKSRPFSEAEFARRTTMTYEGIEMSVVAVEDLIIAKLEWSRKGGSARQVEDAASLLRVAGRDLDEGYLTQWIDALGLQEEWHSAQRVGGSHE